MATIAENLARIQSAKVDIKDAIEAKGVTVPSSATIDTYDDYVSQISGGGENWITTIPQSSYTGTSFSVGGAIMSVDVPSGITSLDSEAFRGYVSLTGVTLPNSLTSIGSQSFRNCNSLSSITIPDSVTTIGYEAFRNCSGLTSIDIPNSVTSIGNSAFYQCTSLTSCTIGNGVTIIGYDAFEYCESLTSIDIPDSVTTINDSAFKECTSLTSCTIGNGVTSIGESAFSSCRSLTSIRCLATTPPTLGTDAFYDTNDCPIYVPSGSVNDYKSAWSDYASRIDAIPNS